MPKLRFVEVVKADDGLVILQIHITFMFTTVIFIIIVVVGCVVVVLIVLHWGE